MKRRQFISGMGAAALFGISGGSSFATGSRQIPVRVDFDATIGSIPPDFPGLGFEISSVATAGLLTAQNQKYVQLLRNISPNGVVRVGGNTSDLSVWLPDGTSFPSPRGTVTNKASIVDLGTFLQATGWKLIWGLNLGTGTAESAADQAAAVAEAAGANLLCFEIGNEPDLFAQNGLRPNGYDYNAFHAEFRRFADILRNRVPGAPLAGPDAALTPAWVGSFAKDEVSGLKLLTEHYYVSGAGDPGATLDNLLRTDPRFVNMTGQLQADSASSGVPYRLVELNSFSGGGKPGVSDTFASALWGLDLMFTLAMNGGGGLNWETGVNHLGVVSSYSPIFEDAQGNFSARPLYYALLAFRAAVGGQLASVSYDGSGVNLKAYGFRASSGEPWVVLINKDLSTEADVDFQSSNDMSSGEVWWLSAPQVNSTTGVTFGGAEVSPAGTWTAGERDQLRAAGGRLSIVVPPEMQRWSNCRPQRKDFAAAAGQGFSNDPQRSLRQPAVSSIPTHDC